MTNSKQSTVWLGISFFTIVSLLAAVSIYSMSNLTLINRHLDIISGEYQTKIFLTATMRRAARERTVNLLHMIILEDPFEQDEEWLKFNMHGTEFANARLSLLSMAFDNIEQSLLNRQRRITVMNLEAQKEVAELALSNKKDEATKLLRSKAIPLQEQVFKILNNLYLHYENTLKLKKREAEHSYRRISIFNWFAGSTALIIGIIISVLTIRNVSKTRARLVQNQKQLQLSQQRLEMALDATNDGLWDWDIQNNSIYYSPRWKRMLGYKDADIGTDFFFWEQIIHPDDKEKINQCVQDNLGAKTEFCSGEYRIRKANGDWLWIMDRGKVTSRDETNKPLRAVGIHTDISQRKQMEKELEDKQKFVTGVLNDLQTAVAILDRTGKITFINDSPLKDIGLNANIIGQYFSDCPLWSHNPEIKKLVTKQIQDACHGISSIEDIQIQSPQGQVWINLSIHPVFNLQGKIEYLVPEIREITDRINAEEALRRSQKMEAIGQLSGGIAHDFNNQLGIVIGYLEMLTDYKNNKPETVTKWLDSAYRASLRCIDLTRQLLSFSRHQTTEKTIVNINEYIDSMCTMIDRSLTPEIEIQYSLADPLWDTLINPGEFQDAVLNLIINARDAMPDGGHLFIQTSNIHLDINHTNYEPHIKTGDYVELLIGDTGSGISKENLDHIFEPFFSTKPRGQATGQGLAMIYAFVKRNSGYINIQSEENKGTTFYLYFPREIIGIDNTQDTAKLNKKLPCGTETILIVDDEADLAELASTYLNTLGYKTIQAVDTELALQILETHKNIDLLFSDIIMPGNINGYQLAETALQLQPDIKILLTSGFTSRTKSTPALKELNDTLLKKPYLKADLAKAVRKSLDS